MSKSKQFLIMMDEGEMKMAHWSGIVLSSFYTSAWKDGLGSCFVVWLFSAAAGKGRSRVLGAFLLRLDDCVYCLLRIYLWFSSYHRCLVSCSISSW